jgi:hypothetical protein
MTTTTVSRLDLLEKHGRNRLAIHIRPGQFVRMYDENVDPFVVRVFRWDEGVDVPTGQQMCRIFGFDADKPVTEDSPVEWMKVPAGETVLSISARDAKRCGLTETP